MAQRASTTKRQQEAAEKVLKLQRDRQLNDVRFCLAHPQGRRVLSEIMSLARLYEHEFDASSKQFYFAGQRSIGFAIKELLKEAEPDSDLKVEQERRTMARNDQRLLDEYVAEALKEEQARD